MSTDDDNNDEKLDLDVAEEEDPQQEEVLVVKMSDDMIAVIRELVQLTLLTGTNIVDHLRAITCEIDAETSKLVPTEEYVDAYNDMIGDLVKKAEESAAALEATEAAISPEDLTAGNFGVVVDTNNVPHFGNGDPEDPNDVN